MRNLFEAPQGEVGNTNLVKYGHQTERSDYRIHVGYKVRQIYVFETRDSVRASARCVSEGMKEVNVYTGDLLTARGIKCPTIYIPGLQTVDIPADLAEANKIYETDDTSVKGLLAARIALSLIKRGKVSLRSNGFEVNTVAAQIDGTDIVIENRLKIQVKCDFKAGPRSVGGTGNVFLQTWEANPYKKH